MLPKDSSILSLFEVPSIVLNRTKVKQFERGALVKIRSWVSSKFHVIREI